MQTAVNEIVRLFLEKTGERDELKKRIIKLDSEILNLSKSHKNLTGEELIKRERTKPVLDYVEDMLKEHGELHVDTIIAALRDAGIQAPKQSVAAGLIRYHNQEKRFKRVAPNTFALRKKEEEREREKITL